ncbi:hypothetical protein NDI44_17955 [Trichocoleus sp. DQ-A3]|uniref:hypothetical protein n=1 Tax=Coleofasciculus sp. FACHB-125 TaxID=2692784 RepID=UPI001687A390|nr:hypothetical protein [Coleofasciculus sp. FACHB-125]MBD1899701.1 hypothetical protein [Coleofasciculus sp. FACHB-125]
MGRNGYPLLKKGRSRIQDDRQEFLSVLIQQSICRVGFRTSPLHAPNRQNDTDKIT